MASASERRDDEPDRWLDDEPDRSHRQDDEPERLHRLDIVGVRVELPSKQPIVLLKEADGELYLPIWIGAVEATSIAFAMEEITTARPMTHDLMRDILGASSIDLAKVAITDLQDGVFFAVLFLSNGAEVSARPSDAIALAMRMNAPVYAAAAVLAEAGITTPEDDGTADDGSEDDGTADDGSEDDGTADDGTEDDGTEDDGTADDGSADDGSADDGTADDGSADDGQGGNESAEGR